MEEALRMVRIRTGSLAHQVATLATGAGLAQLLLIAATPLVTRLYGPEVFGVLGAFLAVANVLKPVSALTLPGAIPLAASDQEANRLGAYSIAVSALLCFMVAITLALFSDTLSHSLGLGGYGVLLWYLPVVMFSSSAVQVSQQWLLRHSKAGPVASGNAWYAGFTGGGQLLGGVASASAHMLVLATSVAHVFHAALMAIRGARVNPTAPNDRGVRPGRELIRAHIDFPLFRAPQQLLSAFAQNVPVLLLAALSGPASAGFYALGKRILAAPVALVGKALLDAFYPTIARRRRQGLAPHLSLRRPTLWLGLIGVPPLVIVVATGPDLFSFVFGSEWHHAGEYARWIAVWAYTLLLNRPAIACIPVVERQASFLLFELLSLIARLTITAVAWLLSKDDLVLVATFALTSAAANLLLVGLVFCWSKRAAPTRRAQSDRPDPST